MLMSDIRHRNVASHAQRVMNNNFSHVVLYILTDCHALVYGSGKWTHHKVQNL